MDYFELNFKYLRPLVFILQGFEFFILLVFLSKKKHFFVKNDHF